MKLQMNDIVIATIVATCAISILVAFSITYLRIFMRKRKEHREEINEFKKQFETQLLQSRIEVQEQTFQQIGKDLHDNLGQLLSTSRMLLGLTERSMQNPPDTLLTANATLGQAISELRAMSKSLDKEWLQQFNFSENLSTEVARINNAGAIHVSLSNSMYVPLRPDEQIILYRIVQEAIQNALKHSSAKNISIVMAQENNRFLIKVQDDGNGFTSTGQPNGMGLINMKHRTALLGGTVTWNQALIKGTIVEISLPVKEQTI